MNTKNTKMIKKTKKITEIKKRMKIKRKTLNLLISDPFLLANMLRINFFGLGKSE